MNKLSIVPFVACLLILSSCATPISSNIVLHADYLRVFGDAEVMDIDTPECPLTSGAITSSNEYTIIEIFNSSDQSVNFQGSGFTDPSLFSASLRTDGKYHMDFSFICGVGLRSLTLGPGGRTQWWISSQPGTKYATLLYTTDPRKVYFLWFFADHRRPDAKNIKEPNKFQEDTDASAPDPQK